MGIIQREGSVAKVGAYKGTRQETVMGDLNGQLCGN